MTICGSLFELVMMLDLQYQFSQMREERYIVGIDGHLSFYYFRYSVLLLRLSGSSFGSLL